MSVPEPGKGSPDEPTGSPSEQSFDPGAIQSQMRPAAARFSSGGGGLGARIAAAQGGTPPTGSSSVDPPGDQAFGPVSGPVAGPTRDRLGGVTDSTGPVGPMSAPAFGADPAEAIVFDAPVRNASTPPPIEYEAERFDPDALFGNDDD